MYILCGSRKMVDINKPEQDDIQTPLIFIKEILLASTTRWWSQR